MIIAAAFSAAWLSPAFAETVQTLAGDGRTGNQDGSSLAASFAFPTGLAYDKSGTLFVADGAGQRIRAISKDGEVRTLAGGGEPATQTGWILGAYADGSGAQARFDRPTGIAVAADGTVFVADAYNNAIRRISHGAVTTWVRKIAMPIGLAIDRADNLYAITENGDLFRIDRSGSTSLVRHFAAPPKWDWDFINTIPALGYVQWSIAVADGPQGPALFIGDGSGLYARTAKGWIKYFRNNEETTLCSGEFKGSAYCAQPAVQTVGLKNIGFPSGIAAVNDHLVACTDDGSNVVRLVNTDTGTIRRIAGSVFEDRSSDTAGYLDGNADFAELNRPIAIALSPDGRLAIADAGNRRIRLISDLDRHDAFDAESARTLRNVPESFSIAYAGDASIWPGELWNRTVEGQLEAIVRGNRSMRNASVVPVVLSGEHGDVLGKLATLAGGPHHFDAVVLQLSAGNVARYPEAQIAQMLRAARARFLRTHTAFYVVATPPADRIAPAEALWQRLLELPQAASALRVPVIDAAATFSQLSAKGQGPFLAARAEELAPLGRATVARLIGKAMRSDRPAPSFGSDAAANASRGTISTFAGSGIPGITDGPAFKARFVMPTALAYLRNGDLLVVDTAAQRIRMISPSGNVSTLAGSGAFDAKTLRVAGGYKDGKAVLARFNWPRGVAVGRDGAIYVADTGNHCIRVIKNGHVSTLLGRPGSPGHPLSKPMGIAIDAHDTIYVADPGVGLLKRDSAGTISIVPGFRGPYAVGTTPTPSGDYIFAFDADGLYIRLPMVPEDRRVRSINQPDFRGPARPSTRKLLELMPTYEAPLGYPGGLATYGEDSLFFGDVRTNTVRYLWPYGDSTMMRVVAGDQTEDASNSGAGYADGPANRARFNAPMGVVSGGPGRLMIADAGNRRIRLLKYDISDLELKQGQAADEARLAASADDEYRMAFIGNSVVYYDQSWSDSIAGLVEKRLRDDGALAAWHLIPAVRVGPGVGDLAALASVAQTVAATGLYRAVILNLNRTNFGDWDLNSVLSTPEAVAEAVARLKSARKVLADAGIPLIVMLEPSAGEVAWSEDVPRRIDADFVNLASAPHGAMRRVLAEAGVDFIDVYAEVAAQEAAPTSTVFAGMFNAHASRHGRLVMSEALARGLERLRPWASQPPRHDPQPT